VKLHLDKRYLKMPIRYHAKYKRICFYANSKLVYDLMARLDPVNPDEYYYADLRHLLGRDMDIICEPDIGPVSLACADAMPPALAEHRYRPVVHFTPQWGWLNDPNGLIYYEGKYHVFFQHNPVDPTWQNMHWGHAASSDLFNWEQMEDALLPDEMGTMFSGSAIADTRNVTGLKRNEHDPLLLFYTAAGGTSLLSADRTFTQCLAFSTDGGMTFQKYERNPVVGNFLIPQNRPSQNRDPKVIYHAAARLYYMALYYDQHTYYLLTSANLLDWQLLQEIELPQEDECPDFYPIMSRSDGRTYWILSGAHEWYHVGDLDPDGRFRPLGDMKTSHYGIGYAAQTFSGLPDGRVIKIAWNKILVDGAPFSGSLSLPLDIRLCTVDGEHRLLALPVPEIGAFYQASINVEPGIVLDYRLALAGKVQDIDLELADCAVDCEISLFGLHLTINPAAREIQVKASSGETSLPIRLENGRLKLRIIFDLICADIFAEDGWSYLGVEHYSDFALNNLEIRADGGCLLVEQCRCSQIGRNR
jgi:fructan beta-fructosidase